MFVIILCLLDRASSWYFNKGRPTWWHLLYYVNLLLNIFRMLIHPSSGACDYLLRCCVGCNMLTWGVLVLCSGIVCWWCGIRVQAEPAYTLIPHHQQPIPLHNTSTPQVSLHNNAPSSLKLLKMDVLTSEICWAVNWDNKASVIKLVYLYSKKFVIIFIYILIVWFMGPYILLLDATFQSVMVSVSFIPWSWRPWFLKCYWLVTRLHDVNNS